MYWWLSWRCYTFQNNDIKEFTDVLEGFNYEKHGEEVMYSGINGEQMRTSIYRSNLLSEIKNYGC